MKTILVVSEYVADTFDEVRPPIQVAAWSPHSPALGRRILLLETKHYPTPIGRNAGFLLDGVAL